MGPTLMCSMFSLHGAILIAFLFPGPPADIWCLTADMYCSNHWRYTILSSALSKFWHNNKIMKTGNFLFWLPDVWDFVSFSLCRYFSVFFTIFSLSVSKGFSSVPAQVLLNLCVMHFTYTSALLRLIKTRWNKEGVMTGILVQPVIFSADRVLLPQNWSYYLAHIRIVKLIQLDCCAQRDRPLL